MLLFLAAAMAASCGGGSDVTGPPNNPPGEDPVASVEVTPPAVNLGPGQSTQLSATPRAANGAALTRAITWTSADEAIATVDQSGKVSAVAAGTVEVSATSEGKHGVAEVTVSEVPVATVEVVPDPSSVALGRTAQLAAVTRAGGGEELPGRPVAWVSSDLAIATVSGTGLVTGVAVGEVTITAASEGKTGTSRLTVSAVEVATVAVDPPTASIDQGDAVTLTAVAKDANGTSLPGRPATWTSSDAGVARVSAIGRVTGVGPGTATITATIEGKTGAAEVTVSLSTGGIRTWKGGAPGQPADWATAANWDPQGKPLALDSIRVPDVADPAVLSENAEVAQLLIQGGSVRNAGHVLTVRAKKGQTIDTEVGP
jgi:uncharacterized protein YjdB